MSVDERAKDLADTLYHKSGHGINECKSVLREERRLALEEAIKACGNAWAKAKNSLPHHGDCQTEIRKLMEE